jgi:hypothetical protein
MQIEIKHRGGSVLHTIKSDSIKAAVEALVKQGADLRETILRGANLVGANLVGADLREADLREAILRGANLGGADLGEADLREADLREAILGGADLGEADLRETILRGANLVGADLGGADLRGADLRGAYLAKADLSGANLVGADLVGADLRGASYGPDIPITTVPVSITGLLWNILILDWHMKIGCELHSFADWKKFKDPRISKMDGNALDWWKVHRKPLMALIAAVRPGKEGGKEDG